MTRTPKRAFTLLEVMVSVALLTIIFSYFYQSVNGMKKSTNFYEEKYNSIEDLKKYIGMLQRDLILHIGDIDFFAQDDKNYTIVSLQTQNSLYNIEAPYVVWYVDKDKNRLKRIESFKPFELPIIEDFHMYYIDEVARGISSFKLYMATNKKNILTYIKQISFNPIVFEIPNIYAKDSNTSDITL